LLIKAKLRTTAESLGYELYR